MLLAVTASRRVFKYSLTFLAIAINRITSSIMLLLLLPLLLGSAFLSTGTSADPFSPFNRNKAHQDNYHPSGISFGPPPPPQRFSEALRNHPSLDQQPQSDGKFDVVYQWRIMDFEFPSAEARRRALASG